MVKKGQVSVFIIVGIFLVLAIVALFFLRKPVTTISPDVMPIHNFMQECIMQTGEYAIFQIGQTGGYYIPVEKSTLLGAAIYFDQGRNLIPSKQKIENEISAYMEEMMFFCIANLEDFEGFQIISKNPKVNTIIKNNKVVYEVDLPITIKKDRKTFYLESFEAETSVRLDMLYETIKDIVEEQFLHPEEVCVTCITRIAEEKDLYFEMFDYEEGVILFSIRDENSKILEEAFEFKFAMRY
jgi:hypothetical protein